MTYALDTEYLRCGTCAGWLPDDQFYTDRSKRNRRDRASRCKACHAVWRKGYYADHREEAIRASRDYAIKNAEVVRAKRNAYARANRTKGYERVRAWKRDNPEAARAMSKRYESKMTAADRALRNHRRRARVRAADTRLVTKKDMRRLLRSPCVYCGAKCQHLDHVIPIARGGRQSVGNLAPSCAKCNQSKSARFIAEWKYGKSGGVRATRRTSGSDLGLGDSSMVLGASAAA